MEASGKTFVLSGQFALGDKKIVVEQIEARGGRVAAEVSKKVDYVVVGGSRSNLWKFGAYGAKIEKARGSKARARRSRSSPKEISQTRSAKTTHIPWNTLLTESSRNISKKIPHPQVVDEESVVQS